MTHRNPCLIVAVMLCTASLIQAQAAPTPSLPDRATVLRQRVVVSVEGSKRELRGRLLQWGSDGLTLEVPNEGGDAGPARITIDVPMTRVRQVDIETHDSLINGALIGAAYLAACFKWWCGQGTSGPVPSPWVGAGLGALVGASLDAALFGRRTVFQAGVVTGPGPIRAGVSLQFRF